MVATEKDKPTPVELGRALAAAASAARTWSNQHPLRSQNPQTRRYAWAEIARLMSNLARRVNSPATFAALVELADSPPEILETRDLPPREVDGVMLMVRQLRWSDARTTFVVLHMIDGGSCTELRSETVLNAPPAGDKLAKLLHEHRCERCRGVQEEPVDPDCGLCDACTEYNAGRVVL